MEFLKSNWSLLLLSPLAHSLTISPAYAQEPLTSAQQFIKMRELEGTWAVEETDKLTVRFEITANKTAVIERWETTSGLHSLTVYHMDGANFTATHYCPQGNQPRLVARESSDGTFSFSFVEATDLDSSESFAHDLNFEFLNDGLVKRSEVYWGPNGAQPTQLYTLHRKK